MSKSRLEELKDSMRIGRVIYVELKDADGYLDAAYQLGREEATPAKTFCCRACCKGEHHEVSVHAPCSDNLLRCPCYCHTPPTPVKRIEPVPYKNVFVDTPSQLHYDRIVDALNSLLEQKK